MWEKLKYILFFVSINHFYQKYFIIFEEIKFSLWNIQNRKISNSLYASEVLEQLERIILHGRQLQNISMIRMQTGEINAWSTILGLI